ncbi:MAG: FAD-dependent oxidoreductase [Thermoguttaceae bacterium]|nr:FAD-dependent oxidoreductase [Thermoguttaceae bacterium]MDW8039635.1 FAD-dependent oxidoreductase [Thermoguttaceae bacterium]
MASKRVLIVGGVAGGASCAARLRRLDEQADIYLFERGPEISFANCGLPYYLGGVIANRQQLLVASPERFRDWFRIEVRTRHDVQRIDRQNRQIEVVNIQTGQKMVESYDALVLSPGAAPIRPNVPGVDLPGIFTLRTLEDADRIVQWIADHKPRRAVVVGAGYIGLELAENLVHRGLEVILLEKLPHVLPSLDEEMVLGVEEELRQRGVEVRLGCALAGFEPSDYHRLSVLTEPGERILADMVLLAVGVRPDVRLAQEAGLAIGPTGGIQVDEQMRTSDPYIWAVGDAVEVRDWITGQPTLIPLAGPAARQGRIAAESICGRPTRYRGSQGTAIVQVFSWVLACTGANERKLRQCGIPYEKIYLYPPHHASYYPGATPLQMKVLFSPDNGRLLGAQIVGRQGVAERINVLAFALQKQATVFDLEEAELAYAPQFGSVKDPINMAGFIGANILRGDMAIVHWEQCDLGRLADLPEQSRPLILDVRTPGERATAAAPGSIHIPLGELRTRLQELPTNRPIWVYCGAGQRGYYAARILQQHGFQVANISGGFACFRMLQKCK